MSLVLLIAAISFAAVEIAATIWLVRQSAATTIPQSSSGRCIYYAGGATGALFIVVMLARGRIIGASTE